MKPVVVLGIIMIALGVLAFVYGGARDIRQGRAVVAPIFSPAQRQVPVLPTLGGMALAGGVVMLLIGTGKH